MDNILIIVLIAIGLILGYITTTGVKSQWVRLIDVFIYGPLLIWTGATQIKNSKYGDIIRVALIFFGATTISYNMRNYIHEKEI